MVRQGLIDFSRGIRVLGSSEDIGDDDDVWTPLRRSDWVHLGITIGYQVAVLLTVLHLWTCRHWPPYVSRQISLVCMTGIAGVVAYFGALVAYGVIRRHDNDFLAQCAVEGLFDYTGWGVWTSVALVRVYRSWKMLVRHSIDMWPAWGQVTLISLPWLLPVVAYSINPDLAGFNERGNWCDINVPIDTALYVYGCVPIFGAFCLSYQMRKVRKQMNFFRMQNLQLLFLLVVGTVIFPSLEAWLETRDDIRRTWIMYDNLVSSLILFWPPIATPLYRYIIGDQEYLNSYTKGFSTLPTPSQMRSSLKDQLSLEELRHEFEKFADSKIARELPDFYKACLDREDIDDFFERQAATSAIIDRFVRIGAEQEVNLNGDVRRKILMTEVTSYNIFNDAMTEVLKMMDNNFSAEFQETEGFKNLERVVEKEAQELEVLRKMKQLPSADHVEADPKGILKLLRRVGESVGTKSSQNDSSSRHSDRTHSSSGRHRSGVNEDDRASLDDHLDRVEAGKAFGSNSFGKRSPVVRDASFNDLEQESKREATIDGHNSGDNTGCCTTPTGQVGKKSPNRTRSGVASSMATVLELHECYGDLEQQSVRSFVPSPLDPSRQTPPPREKKGLKTPTAVVVTPSLVKDHDSTSSPASSSVSVFPGLAPLGPHVRDDGETMVEQERVDAASEVETTASSVVINNALEEEVGADGNDVDESGDSVRGGALYVVPGMEELPGLVPPAVGEAGFRTDVGSADVAVPGSRVDGGGGGEEERVSMVGKSGGDGGGMEEMSDSVASRPRVLSDSKISVLSGSSSCGSIVIMDDASNDVNPAAAAAAAANATAHDHHIEQESSFELSSMEGASFAAKGAEHDARESTPDYVMSLIPSADNNNATVGVSTLVAGGGVGDTVVHGAKTPGRGVEGEEDDGDGGGDDANPPTPLRPRRRRRNGSSRSSNDGT